MNWGRVKKVILSLALFLIFIQMIQPKRTNPSVSPSKSLSAHVAVPEAVRSALMRACGDCHSNRTVWPWYGQVAPFSWVVTDDVNQGRRHMNFDNWEALESPKQANDRLIDICSEIKQKGMPPFSYRLLHKDKELKTEQIKSICEWSNSFRGSEVQQGAVR
jgi:hypothetical protein